MKKAFFAFFVFSLLFLPLRAQYCKLHDFAGTVEDGREPYGSLIEVSGVLYGMTEHGGDHDQGTIFKINPDSSGFSLLRSFTGEFGDGANPHGSLIELGGWLYGMTAYGGAKHKGTIFRVKLDGSGYSLLHSFLGAPVGDGANPNDSLIEVGGILYGMTMFGSPMGQGTVFKINPDGSDYSQLYCFAAGGSDGCNPEGSLLYLDGALYGMTSSKGLNNCGTIFRINPDGGDFSILHSFAFRPDGESPRGSLIEVNSVLYGMAAGGGDYGAGTIFRIRPDGSGFSVIHNFSHSDQDGAFPKGSLVEVDGMLYGMVFTGDGFQTGIIFKITPDGSNFALLHEFTNFQGDGFHPFGSLIKVGMELFGMTSEGGDMNGGIIFSLNYTDSPPTIQVLSPNGGEIWEARSIQAITWSATQLNNVSINLCKEGEFLESIATDIPAYTGTYDWTIPITLVAGSDYSIEINYQPIGHVGYYDRSDGFFTIRTSHVHLVTVTSPNGGEKLFFGSTHYINWTSTNVVGPVNIECSTDGGTSWTSIATGEANDGSYAWTVPATPSTTCLMRVSGFDGYPADSSDAVFTIYAYPAETVSTPVAPLGLALGNIGTIYTYASGNSTSSQGDPVQYKFDWDDSTDSGWLPVGTATAVHNWAWAGWYNVRVKARCATHTAIESSWSFPLEVGLDAPNAYGAGMYNSPGRYKVLPEVIWAQATGGGTWLSAAQVTDVTGGSQVYVYYNTASGRRGPFLLWDNSSGAALSSAKYDNLLETIDGLDSGAFTYCGTVGAVEFFTQDSGHLLHAAARTANGSYAKALPAMMLMGESNMDIPNLASNARYRSACGFFNPTSRPVTMELKLRDESHAQVGSTIIQTLAGHEFLAFDPFIQAGVPYPANSYDHTVLTGRRTSGSGQVVCFGSSANNISNDPAAHVSHGANPQLVIPEIIWAPATGGGTWVSEVQVIDYSGESQVSVYYNTASGRRGPFLLWDNSNGAPLSSRKFDNLLETIDELDSGAFTYYGTVGAVEFSAQGTSQDFWNTILLTARTLNGNYSKMFPGLRPSVGDLADLSQSMLILDCTNNATYRSTCGFYNPTVDEVTVEFTLLDGSGAQIGSQFNRTLAGHDFQSFNPFNQAGVPYPGSSYDNVKLRMRPTSGAGKVMCFGATVDNRSNDPASHLAVQGE